MKLYLGNIVLYGFYCAICAFILPRVFAFSTTILGIIVLSALDLILLILFAAMSVFYIVLFNKTCNSATPYVILTYDMCNNTLLSLSTNWHIEFHFFKIALYNENKDYSINIFLFDYAAYSQYWKNWFSPKKHMEETQTYNEFLELERRK